MIDRGAVYWVDFHGAAGAEIRKSRPAVVVSTSDHNEHMRTVTVVPFSSPNGRSSPYEVVVPEGVVGDGRPSRLKTHQIRAVDKGRLGQKIGMLPARLIRALEGSMLEHLGIGVESFAAELRLRK